MSRLDKGNVKIAWKGLKPFFKRHRLRLLGTVVCALLVAGMTLLVPIALGRAINGIAGGPGTVDMAVIMPHLVIALIALAVLLPAQYFLNVLNNAVTYGIVRDLRDAALSRIEHLSLSYLDGRPQGDLLSRVIADVDSLQEGLLMLLAQALPGVFTIVGAIVMMATLNVKIMLIVLLLTPVSLVLTRVFARLSYKAFRVQSELRGEETSFLNEMIANQKVIQAYGAVERKNEAFAHLDGRLAEASREATFVSSLLNPGTRFLKNVIYALVVLVGSLMVADGTILLGTLSTFIAYTGIYMKPFNEITGIITELQNAIVSSVRLESLLKAPLAQETGSASLDHASGAVTFDHVSFRYEPSRPLITDWSVTVPAATRIALVGPTGCGKTTVINLLMRFYDPDTGTIALDGTDTRTLSRSGLRKNIGMVLQDTWLKNDTVFHNVAFGRPDASLEDVREACRAAHCDSFIMRLPEGYDTVIEESGGNLSQGERQLLCIARLMLVVPSILILDEATSSIDTRTEMVIQEAFANLMKGRTAFIVAHRLQTIRDADLILVMKAGRIVERGTHEELLAHHGFYRELWESQYE